MNKLLISIFGLLIISLAVFLAAYFWWSGQLLPVQPKSGEKITLVITPNQTAAQTISQLAGNNLIKSPLAAKLYLQFSGLDQKIRPGSYILSPGLGLPAVFTSLTSGPEDLWVTIPEGWRREQIATRLAATLSNFDLPGFLTQSATLEGQLFPDTYSIPPQASVSQVINIFLTNFDRKTGLDLPRQNDVLILASLVEREAKSDPDRALIAGIFQKRLAAGWPLQVDASAQYAQGTSRQWWPKNIDTKYQSVYNTYLQSGLPPAPIASPGLASIQAVLHPEDSPYWYYLTGPNGQTYYAKGLAEHNLNIDNYLSP